MVTRITTVAFQGIETQSVDVQVHIAPGLPAFSIVGLADKAVGESRERIRASLQSIGLILPPKRITVNLAPADLQKEGSHYDLPIALALLGAMEIFPSDILNEFIALGELSLDGRISSVIGILPASVYAGQIHKGIICPQENGNEAMWGAPPHVIAAPNLVSLLNHFKGTQVLNSPQAFQQENALSTLDMQDIKGQESAKRVLEIAAAGAHNLLMIGPPGSGKSMLAARLPTILPPLSAEEALEVSMIHSIAGQLKEGRLLNQRPYRDPHQSASLPSLIGGGYRAHPGEVSLAHQGVLFLDEIPEFQKTTLEALRQPLETGYVTIARANAHITYPARFQLIAAMNPCRCGYLNDAARACSKAPKCGQDYQSKLSGPLLDRIDLTIYVNAVPLQKLTTLESPSENSISIKQRVVQARSIQKNRYLEFQNTAQERVNFTNSTLTNKMLEKVAVLSAESQQLLHQAAEKFQLSARAYHRTLKVSRTIADLEASPNIERHHLAEALSYRIIF